jgi:hypothetical protein
MVLIDSKRCRGRLWLDPDDSSGMPPPTRLNPMEAHCAAGQTDAVLRVPDLDVRPILAVHGARSSRPAWSRPGHYHPGLPFPGHLRTLPPILDPDQVV